MAAPPGIGEAIGEGWKAYKANLVPGLIAFFCAGLLGLIPIVGGLLAMPGFANVALKLVRGQKPEPADGFIIFKQSVVDHIIMVILQMIGVILCGFGQLITQPLFFQGTYLILDKGMKWGEAKDKCMAEIKPNLMGWVIFCFVLSIVAFLGVIACVVGVFITGPIAMCGMAYAYEKTLGGGGGGGAAAAPAKA